jgi:hypothetical protein
LVDFSNDHAEICVVGRTSFASGIGSIGFATAELLARNFPVSFLPTEPSMRAREQVTLPSGRILPVCKDLSRIKVSFFCDVLWNGQHDFNYALMPANSLKFAWLVFDSDRLPPRWVSLLNSHFDLLIASSPHLSLVAQQNGVETPTAVMPIPMDLDALLCKPFKVINSDKVRFGSVAAFHPRKGIEVLVEAFIKRFGNHNDVELVLHSNLGIGSVFESVTTLIEKNDIHNIHVTLGDLSDTAKNSLIQSLDVFVSCSRGEGYSIGPREALAAGKALVLSAVGGHNDLLDIPGVFLVDPEIDVPARYPEIDNLVFGKQRMVTATAASLALESAYHFVKHKDYEATRSMRRLCAREWSFTYMTSTIGSLVDQSITRFRVTPKPRHVSIPTPFLKVVESRLGPQAQELQSIRRQVCEAYDAGFFSIFNAFMSHLVWQQNEDRCHGVLPDWDVDRLVERYNGTALSFCYGQPGDGNLWLKLFKPLYGATEDEMQSKTWLWRHAEAPIARHNDAREPLMTYVHAYKLYESPDFASWRRQYHRVFVEHVHLRPELEAEVHNFVEANLQKKIVIGAHVRHPSHTVEQPGAVIAHTEAYIAAVQRRLAQHGLSSESLDWAVFLATDQERVVLRFREVFGNRVSCYDDVRRTRPAEDAAFDTLSPEEKNRDGHQLQHLVAADRANWSSRMAWEVVRDAFTMAHCQCLLHVVSNVSTAVAYMNPQMDMIFCSAEPHVS